MAKRKNGSKDSKTFKKGKFTSNLNIEPGWMGIYATCVRGKESRCRHEVVDLFQEFAEELYGEKLNEPSQDPEESQQSDGPELSIEDAIAKEVGELKQTKKAAKRLFEPMDIGCECVIFIRTRKPIDPSDFVVKLCHWTRASKVKRTRYVQRLTPLTLTATANLEGLKKLAEIVLKPHFHRNEGQTALKVSTF